MYCTQCGFKLEDGTMMCPVCGHIVEQSETVPVFIQENSSKNSEAEKTEKVQEKNVFENKEVNQPENSASQYGGYNPGENTGGNRQMNEPYYGGYYYNNQMQSSAQPKKKSSVKIAVITVCCFAALAALSFGAFIIFGNSDDTSIDNDFVPETNSGINGIDNDVYQDYEDEPFYDNPFSDDEEGTDDDVSLYKGTIAGSAYTNEFFGISYSIPSTYYCLTEEEITEFYGDGNDDMTAGVVGLDIIGDNYSEMVVYSQKFSNFSEELYLNSFIYNSVSGIDESEYVISDTESTTVGGLEFLKRDIEFLNYDPDLEYKYNSFYVKEKDGVFLVISVFYDDAADKENLIAHFI